MLLKKDKQKILNLCEQYKTSSHYQKIVRLMELILDNAEDRESAMRGLTELSTKIWPNQPEKMLRNLFWDYILRRY